MISGTHGLLLQAQADVYLNLWNCHIQIERVRFLGYVEDETLPGLYANATLFVLPSFEEGFGLPALEAMACGTPVIVSDGGALPETVADAGLIFRLDVTLSPSTWLRINSSPCQLP